MRTILPPHTIDCDVFTIENGELKVTTSATNGTDYELINGVLTVNNGFTGTITSTVVFTNEERTKEIDFMYDHNGLRTGKVVTENGRTEITEYTLHGKLITHLTKRTVDENGDETAQELHFFYDAQSRPAFVEYGDTMYRYVHNLQGDVVGIVDGSGSLVVEYKYAAWGKLISTVGSMAGTLGMQNPFRYRGYSYDAETELYYLKSRYYAMGIERFVSADIIVSPRINDNSLFAYCSNNPVNNADDSGLIYYKVTLNIYDNTYSSNNNYGHYDITLIEYNEDNRETTRKTISYGPSRENGSDAIITIHNDNNPRMKDHLYESLMIYDDISESEMEAFHSWFFNEFAGDKFRNSNNQYYVKDESFTKYSFDTKRNKPGSPNQSYCGSASLYLLYMIRKTVSATKCLLSEVFLVMKSMPVFFTKKNTYPIGDLREWFSSKK